MKPRDLDTLANIFSEVYRQDRDIVSALRVVFAVDDARSGRAPVIVPTPEEIGPPLKPRPLKQDKLSRFRQAQMLLPFVEEVARTHGLQPGHLTGGSKLRSITMVRDEAMWTLRARAKASTPSIGLVLGGRDHSTVIAGIRRFETRIAAEPELRARVLGAEGRAA